MSRTVLIAAGLLAGLALAVSAATANQAGVNTMCEPRQVGDVGCVDPIGDVKGGTGPDIARVQWLEWGTQFFHVTFAQGSPLAHSATFTDKVSLYLTAGKKRYVLTVSAKNPRREILRRLPNGKPFAVTPRPAVFPHGTAVTFVVRPYLLRNLTGWRIKVARVMHDGTAGSSDYAPDKGSYG